MPMVLPIIAAAGSIYAGATAIAAGSALIGGLMVAGGALSLVGTLTDNKKLSRIGSVVSLVGGIAGLATGAWSTAADTVAADAYGPSSGWGADTLSAQGFTEGGAVSGMDMAADAGMASFDAMGAGTAGADMAMDYGAGMLDAGSVADVATQALDPAAGVAEAGSLSADNLAALDPAAGAAPSQPVGGVADQAAGNAGSRGLDPAATQPPGGDPAAIRMTGEAPAQSAPGSSASQSRMPTQAAQPQVDRAVQASDTFWGKAKNTVGDAMKWMEKNPTTTKIGAGMIQGAMQSYQRNQAIEDDFKRQQRDRAARREQLSQSITGPNGQGLMIPKWRPSAQGG